MGTWSQAIRITDGPLYCRYLIYRIAKAVSSKRDVVDGKLVGPPALGHSLLHHIQCRAPLRRGDPDLPGGLGISPTLGGANDGVGVLDRVRRRDSDLGDLGLVAEYDVEVVSWDVRGYPDVGHHLGVTRLHVKLPAARGRRASAVDGVDDVIDDPILIGEGGGELVVTPALSRAQFHDVSGGAEVGGGQVQGFEVRSVAWSVRLAVLYAVGHCLLGTHPLERNRNKYLMLYM